MGQTPPPAPRASPLTPAPRGTPARSFPRTSELLLGSRCVPRPTSASSRSASVVRVRAATFGPLRSVDVALVNALLSLEETRDPAGVTWLLPHGARAGGSGELHGSSHPHWVFSSVRQVSRWSADPRVPESPRQLTHACGPGCASPSVRATCRPLAHVSAGLSAFLICTSSLRAGIIV